MSLKFFALQGLRRDRRFAAVGVFMAYVLTRIVSNEFRGWPKSKKAAQSLQRRYSRSTDTAQGMSTKRILIIHEDRLISQLYREKLEASGFAVDTEALPIRADARVLGATVKAGESITHEVGEGRHAYLVPATGAIEIDGKPFSARDGAAIGGGQTVTIKAIEDAELVLVDSE